MGSFLFIILIIFLCVYIRKVPSGYMAVIKRSGQFLKTVNPNTSYFINPSTDTVTLVSITPKVYSNVFTAYSKDRILFSGKIKFTYYVIDPLKVANIHKLEVFNIKAKTDITIKKFFSSRNSSELNNTSNTQTLKINDSLNALLQEVGFSVKNVEFKILKSSGSSDGIKTNKFEKVPCIHTDNDYTENAINSNYDNSNSGELFSENAIKNYDLHSFRNNPIKESISFKQIGIDSLDNTDSNVDPIKNL